MAAVANLATMQTNATAGGLADEAQAAADKAMAAYEHAKAASEDAAAAEEVTAAVEARVLAETAMANAVKYAATASEKGTAAETAATAELMIVGTVKTVGGTDLDAEAGASTVTTNGDSVITGLIKDLNPDHTVAMKEGDGLWRKALLTHKRRCLCGAHGKMWRNVRLISARWLIRRTTWPA